jgi:hypothetical protein
MNQAEMIKLTGVAPLSVPAHPDAVPMVVAILALATTKDTG